MFGQGAPQSLSLGQLGGIVIADTEVHTGDWGILHALTAVVFTAVTSSTLSGSLAGVTLYGGDTIFGRFSSIQLTSGTLIAYNV